MRKGLVIGKFLPPHAGHHFLIDTARAAVDRLTVAVCERPGEPIAAELRARWLREPHPDVEVIIVDAAVPGDDLNGWATAMKAALGGSPDAVFTSESGGEACARALGCAHYRIDAARETFPISSSQIRADPLAALDWVAPNVRAYLVRRVCIVGPESTGKTVLCEHLAERLGAPWVGEYGRDYTLLKLRTSSADVWRPDEFVHIAREQQRREDEAARRSGGLVICDTDAFATEIWLERYLGPQPVSGWPARDRAMDLYLLTDPDVPFVPDAIRDGEHLREWMFARFADELTRRGLPFAILAGDYAERERRAVERIEELLRARDVVA